MTDDLRPLWPHQQRALLELRASLAAGKRRPMLQAPTGFGKTLTAAHIIRRALDKDKRVAFTVPALSLIDQTVAAFEDEGIDAIGVLQGIHPRTDRDQPLQVCSRSDVGPSPAPRRRSDPDRRGASAPPRNLPLDGGLPGHALHRPVGDAMGAGPGQILRRADHRGDNGRPDRGTAISRTSGPSRRASPTSLACGRSPATSMKANLAKRWTARFITADIIETWLKRAENRPTFVFCVNRRHARHVAERFLEVGVAAEYLDGQTSREDREAAFRRFRSGDTLVLVNVGVLSTGVDLDVRCIVDAKPTKSRILIRPDDRPRPAHGAGEDRLPHPRPRRQPPSPRDRSATSARPSSTTAKKTPRRASSANKRSRCRSCCDACKAVLSRADARPASAAASRCAPCPGGEIEGDLVELGGRQSGKRETPEWERRRFFAELLGMAEERGYRRAGPRTSSKKNSRTGRTATTRSRWSRRSPSETGCARGRSPSPRREGRRGGEQAGQAEALATQPPLNSPTLPRSPGGTRDLHKSRELR